MADVEFQEDDYGMKYNQSDMSYNRGGSGIGSWLVKVGLFKKPSTASKVVVIVCVIILVYVLIEVVSALGFNDPAPDPKEIIREQEENKVIK